MPMPKVIIEAPPITPLPYGILSAAVVRDPQDPHESAGVTWEPQFCGPARGTLAACYTSSSLINVNVNVSRQASLSGGSPPPGRYDINWGDGNSDLDVDNDDVLSATNTYAADGDYTVTVTPHAGDDLSRFTGTPVEITVTNGENSGPFALNYTYIDAKITDERADWAVAQPFTVYTISTCRLPGTVDREAYATRALGLGEGRGIEEGLGLWFSDPDADAEVLESGDATSAVVALAWLEQYAGENYGGVATIHMTRAVASVLLTAYALEARDGKLYTRLGNLVIAGSGADYPGIPDGESTEDGETFMFATGTVVVTRGAVNTSPAVISTGGEIDNEYSVLAERIVSVGYECFLAAAKVLPLNAGGAGDGSGGGVDGGTP